MELTKKTKASRPIGVRLNVIPLFFASSICCLEGRAVKIISTLPSIRLLKAETVEVHVTSLSQDYNLLGDM